MRPLILPTTTVCVRLTDVRLMSIQMVVREKMERFSCNITFLSHSRTQSQVRSLLFTKITGRHSRMVDVVNIFFYVV